MRGSLSRSLGAVFVVAGSTSKLPPEVGRPTMDTFTELQQLADDLTELGDNATAALVCQAIDRFTAWKFEAGEELLERALEERRKHDHEPGRAVWPPRSPYFNTCALVIS